MNECGRCLCYGCMHRKDNTVMHNSCSLHFSDQVHFWIYVALDSVDETTISEQYRNEVGLAAFEWLDIFYSDYRRSTWIGGEEWITDVSLLVLDKWTSGWLSSCGGRSGVLLLFEYMLWKDMNSCGWSSQRLSLCGGRTASSHKPLVVSSYANVVWHLISVLFHHNRLVDRIEKKYGHSEGEARWTASGSLLLWHCTVQQFSRVV